MKTKSFTRRVVAVVIGLCMVAAYTPVGVFADSTSDSQDVTPAEVEQTTNENAPATDSSKTTEGETSVGQETEGDTNANEVDMQTADPTAADSNDAAIQTEGEAGTNEATSNTGAADNTDSTGQDDGAVSGPGTLKASELDEDESDIQPLSASDEEGEDPYVGEEADDSSYDDDEYTSDADVPAIVYMIAVIFKGIKKASLINDGYKITFNGITFYKDGEGYSYYLDKVSFTKKNALIRYEYGNVALMWIFNGHRVDADGNDIYTILDLDSARQSKTHIPGYTLKGSKSDNIDFSFNLSWDGEEIDEFDPSQYLLVAGISITENTYEKAGYAATTVMDHSPETGDDQMIGLVGVMMCLSLLGVLLIVLTGRIRREKQRV